MGELPRCAGAGRARHDTEDLLAKTGVQLVGSAGFALTTTLTSASANPRFRAYRLAYLVDAYQQKTPISVETRLETPSPKCCFTVTATVTRAPAKCAFAVNRPVNQGRQPVQKSALSLLSRLLSALQKSAVSLVTSLLTMLW